MDDRTELTDASSPHSSARRSNADLPSRRLRMAAGPNIRHARSNVGPPDTSNPRPMHSPDQARARTRSLEEAAEGVAQHNSHTRDPRRLRRRSVFRQTRSFQPAREEQAISFSFFRPPRGGTIISNHRSLDYFAPALPDADVLDCLALRQIKRGSDWPISTSGVHLWPPGGPFTGTNQNMDDGRDPN